MTTPGTEPARAGGRDGAAAWDIQRVAGAGGQGRGAAVDIEGDTRGQRACAYVEGIVAVVAVGRQRGQTHGRGRVVHGEGIAPSRPLTVTVVFWAKLIVSKVLLGLLLTWVA